MVSCACCFEGETTLLHSIRNILHVLLHFATFWVTINDLHQRVRYPSEIYGMDLSRKYVYWWWMVATGMLNTYWGGIDLYKGRYVTLKAKWNVLGHWVLFFAGTLRALYCGGAPGRPRWLVLANVLDSLDVHPLFTANSWILEAWKALASLGRTCPIWIALDS